jgi:putative lipase involved disintegration of autophagic bodies
MRNRLQGHPVGWEPDADGFRGHVFVSEDNATVVLAIKGTSAGWLVGGGGPTVRKDKFNGTYDISEAAITAH